MPRHTILTIGIWDDQCVKQFITCIKYANDNKRDHQEQVNEGHNSPEIDNLVSQSEYGRMNYIRFLGRITALPPGGCCLAVYYLEHPGRINEVCAYLLDLDSKVLSGVGLMNSIMYLIQESFVRNKIVSDCWHSGVFAYAAMVESESILPDGILILSAPIGTRVTMRQGGGCVFSSTFAGSKNGSIFYLSSKFSPAHAL